MAFQSSLSSVLLMSSLLGGSFLVTKLFKLSVYFVRCLPLRLVPQIFLLHICYSRPSAVFTCPKDCCLFLMVLSSDLLYPVISITSSFDFFSVHDILIILLMYHISAALILLSRYFASVQHTHPCRRMDHYVSVDKAIFFCISLSHLTSGVIVKPNYLNMLTCFILSPLQRLLHIGLSVCF